MLPHDQLIPSLAYSASRLRSHLASSMVRSFVRPLVAWAIASVLSSGAVVDASSPLQLDGINYNTRIGPDWALDTQKCKSDTDVDADLAVLSSVTRRIRIYSLTDCNQGAVVLSAAKRHGLQVELGLWVSGDEAVFHAERERFKSLLTVDGLITKQSVSAIHVGSEAIYRKEVTPETIIGYMKQIKTITTDYRLDIPVTIADIGDVYLAHNELVDAVDFVSANGFPFWEKKTAEESADYFYSRMEKLIERAKKQNKRFVVSETGWASGGVNVRASVAGPENAARYLKDFVALADKHKWNYYYFEAFDEPWKIALDASNTVEGYFGIFHANRTLKREFETLQTSTNPQPTPTPLPTPTPTPTPKNEPNAYTPGVGVGSPGKNGGGPSVAGAGQESAGASGQNHDNQNNNDNNNNGDSPRGASPADPRLDCPVGP